MNVDFIRGVWRPESTLSFSGTHPFLHFSEKRKDEPLFIRPFPRLTDAAAAEAKSSLSPDREETARVIQVHTNT
jgi:hypothetical protein